jgi:hypothetical protein
MPKVPKIDVFRIIGVPICKNALKVFANLGLD